MAFLNTLYRNGIWLSVPLFVAGVALLVFFISSVVKLSASSQLASLPLLEQQPVQFHESGRVVLSLDGPRLSKRFSELDFELAAPGGSPLPGRRTWFHAMSSGITTVKMELMVFTLPDPGQYLLRIRNLGASRDGDAGHRVVFSRPHLPQTVGFIFGIILSAGLTIGSIVLFALRLLNKGETA